MHTTVKSALESDAPRDHILVQGWVRTRRDSKDFSFLEVNDGSCLKNLQVIADAGIDGYDDALKATTGASVAVEGALVESQGKGQAWELHAKKVTLLGTADDSYPLQKKGHSAEFLRSIAHLRPRSNLFGCVFRVRSRMAYAIHTFFQERGFVHVHTPIITASDCEGAGEMFRITADQRDAGPGSASGQRDAAPGSASGQRDAAPGSASGQRDAAPGSASGGEGLPAEEEDEAVASGGDGHFFGKPAFLTVSGQLAAETFACAFSNVYTFGPTFRAENSHTSRHASEFWMIEPEMAFCDLFGDMSLAEEMVKYLVADALEHNAGDLELFGKFVDKGLLERLNFVLEREFQRVPYTEAVEILSKSGKKFEYPIEWGLNLQSEHERFLTEEHCKCPVTVFDYPKKIKPFYMRANDDGKTVAAMDLLVPGIGEIVGGSQREERLDVLRENMARHDLVEEDYSWYVDLRKFGSVPHAGFGLGFERMLMFVTGVANIRDVIPFPRVPGWAEF